MFGESTNVETQPYKYNGKEFDGMYGLNLFDYGARHYDAAIGRWMNMDPLSEGHYNISSYAYCGNNPVRFVDPNGMFYDDYYINGDGTIEVTKTNDNFDRFYFKNKGFNGTENHTTLIGQFNKNEKGLIQLDDFSYSNFDFGASFSFEVKDGNESRSYIRSDALASLFGAMATTDFHDITIIGVSNFDGSSPPPSVSHKDGKNIDFRYLRTDKTGDRVLLGKKH